MKLQLIILIHFITVYKVFCDGSGDEKRVLKVSKNPGCDKAISKEICDSYVMFHIEAESDANTLHYIWDFIGKPAIMIAQTDKNATLSIDWTKINGSTNCISFTSEPKYVLLSAINNIVLYNDSKDKSNYSELSTTEFIKFNPLNLNWTLINVTENEGNSVMLEMSAENNVNNGSFNMKFTAYGFSAHDEDLPHLFHTPHSMQIDLIASKIRTNFSSPRIAIELLMISSEYDDEGDFKLNRIRNLDDEFTPGIFDVYNLLSPRSYNGTIGGYFQFRPVCYVSKTRTVSSSTESRQGNLIPMETDDFQNSLAANYFKNMAENLKEAINITFGMPGDGFYSRTNYISFSFSMGIGVPPKESLSTFVLTFATLGLGIPLLVLTFGGSYVAIKKYRS